jgi:hypothetical protein
VEVEPGLLSCVESTISVSAAIQVSEATFDCEIGDETVSSIWDGDGAAFSISSCAICDVINPVVNMANCTGILVVIFGVRADETPVESFGFVFSNDTASVRDG